MKCEICDTEATIDSTFCMNCGSSLNNNNSIFPRSVITKRDVKKGLFDGGLNNHSMEIPDEPFATTNESASDYYRKKKPVNPFKMIEQKDRDRVLVELTEKLNELLETKEIGGADLKNFKVKKIKKGTYKNPKPHDYRKNPSYKITIEFEVVNKLILVVGR